MIYRADFPYRLTRANGLKRIDPRECTINPEDEIPFEVARSWVTDPPDNRLIVNRIDTKRAPDSYLEMFRDERCSLRYRVPAANLRSAWVWSSGSTSQRYSRGQIWKMKTPIELACWHRLQSTEAHASRCASASTIAPTKMSGFSRLLWRTVTQRGRAAILLIGMNGTCQ